jgi:hypothetical protein
MRYTAESVEECMSAIKNCVRAGRKVKDGTRTSLKGKSFAVSFKIPFAVMFLMALEEDEKIVQNMLRADYICYEECGWDQPFQLTEVAEMFPYFSGVAISEQVEAMLWTREPLWT